MTLPFGLKAYEVQITETIVRLDVFLMAFNPDVTKKQKKKFVDLKCGHKALVPQRHRGTTVCVRCTEMLHRSLQGTGEDYDGFRNHGMRDTMIWRDDPCRQFNEKTDLAGRFVDDPEIVDDPES